MARVNAQQWLDRWGTGLSGAGQRVKDGVARVAQAPGQAAAAKQEKMRAGINAAIDSGKWAKNVGSVSLASWQTSMTTTGITNMSTGVQKAKQNKVAKIQQMLDDNDAALAAIANMPSDTFEQRVQRSVAYQHARRTIAQQRGA